MMIIDEIENLKKTEKSSKIIIGQLHSLIDLKEEEYQAAYNEGNNILLLQELEEDIDSLYEEIQVENNKLFSAEEKVFNEYMRILEAHGASKEAEFIKESKNKLPRRTNILMELKRRFN
ncbi:hypothetical protein [uncultured Methanobrevibacter sp.]|uniref:hypothetical protein n=1 Tax=uncultured Methanobrevibacter sp. TaxID=253161 RepID=UPI002601B84A|nr:hypothetical protein [uncultured Methanobrevibacter sp.]